MKRQELLRQLDQEADYLKAKAADLARRIQEFKAAEKQRVPKWAKPKKSTHENEFSLSRWYPVAQPEYTEGRWVWKSKSNQGFRLTCYEHNDLYFGVQEWELCYSDNPPEEKNVETNYRVLRLKEQMQKGDCVEDSEEFSIPVGSPWFGKPVYKLLKELSPAKQIVRFDRM